MEMRMVRGLLRCARRCCRSAAAQAAAAKAPVPAMPMRSAPRACSRRSGDHPRVGRKHFPQTLPLAPKEVVLTFDDGPEPGTTGRVLDALKRECVRASFFLLGRSAAAHPALARRELAEGHTVAHHIVRASPARPHAGRRRRG